MKILLVEDNPVDRMFVMQSLRQVEGFDYELVDCESLAEAQQQIVASRYDVILLDLWLPDCEGLETCVLSLARLQPGVRTLTFGGAGADMLIVNPAGQVKQRLDSSGVPFGVLEDFRYQAPAHVSLEPGDILLLLTDGFCEARNREGDLFGVSGIAATVAANSHAAASEIFKALWRAVRKFADGHRQQDDMTGIVVKVLAA